MEHANRYYHLNKILENTRKGFILSVALNASYFCALIGTGLINTKISKQIQSKTQLEQIIGYEKNRAGIDPNANVVVEISENPKTVDYAKKIGENSYKVVLSSPNSTFGTCRSSLRHELYHIADGHCDATDKIKSRTLWNLRYLYVHEPQAMVYELTGIKL